LLEQVASFLHRELPIRLAHRALELEATKAFRQSPSIMNVCNWYKRSFYELRDTAAPLTQETEARFAKVVESIYERHSSTLITMAKGAHEIRTALKQDINTFAESQDIQKRLDDFYMSRIGIRMVSVTAVEC
jgi:pyruvate dehydrogenase kinase 2/3/4